MGLAKMGEAALPMFSTNVVLPEESPNEGVEVAVAVDVGEGRGDEGGGEEPETEGARHGGREGGSAPGPRVREEEHLAAVPARDERANEEIEVAVAVDVGEGRRLVAAHDRELERPEEGRRRRSSRVREEHAVAGKAADEDVEVAVAVDVGEGGGGELPDVLEAEGVHQRDREGGLARGSGVLEEDRIAGVLAVEGVEVAVPVEVGEARGSLAAHVREAEGIGDGRGEAGGGRVPVFSMKRVLP